MANTPYAGIGQQNSSPWWQALANMTGAKNPQIMPSTAATATPNVAENPWYQALGQVAAPTGIDIQSLGQPAAHTGIDTQTSLGQPQQTFNPTITVGQGPDSPQGINVGDPDAAAVIDLTGPQQPIDARYRVPVLPTTTPVESFKPTITVGSGDVVDPGDPRSGFSGDDYDAEAIIAFARPDIFAGIGKNTGWDMTGQRGINGWTEQSGTISGDTQDWSSFGGRATGDPIHIQRTIEEWIHMGEKGTPDASTTPYNGDKQAIAAALYSKLTPDQIAKAKILAAQFKALDYMVYKLTDGGQYNDFAKWGDEFGKSHWGGSFDTLENARKSVVAWVKTQAAAGNPAWGDGNTDIVHIAQKYGYDGTSTPQQLTQGLYQGEDKNPISAYLWLNFDRKGAGLQKWHKAYTQPYMKSAKGITTTTPTTGGNHAPIVLPTV